MTSSYTQNVSQYDLHGNGVLGPIAQKNLSDKFCVMSGHDFERTLVEVMVDLAEKKGFKHKPLAISAWKDRKDPATKWRKIRNGTDPRGLQVQDAYDLAAAMGVSFVELCGMAQARLMQMDIATPSCESPSKKEHSKDQESYTGPDITPTATGTTPIEPNGG